MLHLCSIRYINVHIGQAKELGFLSGYRFPQDEEVAVVRCFPLISASSRESLCSCVEFQEAAARCADEPGGVIQFGLIDS